MSISVSTRWEVQDKEACKGGGHSIVQELPFGLTLTKCHAPFAPTGTGCTGHLAEIDLMQIQMTCILWYKHPPTRRTRSIKQHKLTCIQQ
jgi:hypothetical protein